MVVGVITAVVFKVKSKSLVIWAVLRFVDTLTKSARISGCPEALLSLMVVSDQSVGSFSFSVIDFEKAYI